ncbi:hypothetical protein TSUD_10950 [Trifolium subterraneum]|nr:hypothetical protein TSUD_10950 [Trifolium subterraneum]
MQQENSLLWQPPPEGYVKCNFDVAMFEVEGKVGIGTCLRDVEGAFIGAMTDFCNAVMTVTEAECWSLFCPLEWLAYIGYQHVVMEMNCKLVIEDVCNGKENRSEYSMILQDCRIFLRTTTL